MKDKFYTKLDENNCAKGLFSEDIHGNIYIEDKETIEEVSEDEFLNKKDDYIYSKRLVLKNGKREECYFRFKKKKNPLCKIPSDSVEITKEIFTRHRKVCKQQYDNGKWIDYIESDEKILGKLIKEVASMLKKDRDFKLRELTVEKDGFTYEADSKSLGNIKNKILSSEYEDTIKWIDKGNNVFDTNKENLEYVFNVANENESDIIISSRIKINDLENKSKDELLKIKEELINGNTK